MRTTEENGILIHEEEVGDALYDTNVLTVLDVQYDKAYKLHILFSNGERRTVDFELVLRRFPPLTSYLNLEKFKAFRLYNGNVQWNAYEMIFPVKDLYNGFGIEH
jgi:Protein of unknown function (DUF2442)